MNAERGEFRTAEAVRLCSSQRIETRRVPFRTALVAERHPVLAVIRGAEERAARIVDEDGLAAAERDVDDLQIVTAARELRSDAFGDRRLDLEAPGSREAARPVRRCLDVEPEIEHVRQEPG